MKSNYNNIIDIILTLIQDKEIQENLIIGGSIVPYLILNKESKEYHPDFYIYFKEKKFDIIRRKVKKMCKEYEMDIISDSSKNSDKDYGFKVKYDNTIVGFFPYSLINNNFKYKSYNINTENKTIKLKDKIINGVSKSDVIRSCEFSNMKIRILSPELVLSQIQTIGSDDMFEIKEHVELLKKIVDKEVLRNVRTLVNKSKTDIESRKIKEGIPVLSLVIVLLLLVLILVAFICIKK